MNRICNFLIRVLLYAIGLLILAFGVAISINSDLGVSPVSALPYVVSIVFQRNLSTCVIIVYSFYTVLQILIMGKDYKWYNLFQIAFSTMYGYFIDFAKWVVGDFVIPTYFGRLLMMVFSTIIIACGNTIYVGANLIAMPMDGLAQSFAAKKPGSSFATMKTLTGCVSVAACIIISLALEGRVIGVREGTVFTAVFIGVFISQWHKILLPLLSRMQTIGQKDQKQISETDEVKQP